MSDIIDNSEDVIDSRDIEERIEELQELCKPWRAKLCDFAGIDKEEDFAAHDEACEALAEWLEEHAEYYEESVARQEELNGAAIDVRALAEAMGTEFSVGESGLTATIEVLELDSDTVEELDSLKSFRDELADYCPDWRHGTTIVRESHWVEYVQEMLADIGDLPKDLPGYIAIDWDKTADNVREDYTSADFDGVTYWAR